ncbi:hypothetical protein V8C43DRAFT_75050 [Trichoderma afarasin]
MDRISAELHLAVITHTHAHLVPGLIRSVASGCFPSLRCPGIVRADKLVLFCMPIVQPASAKNAQVWSTAEEANGAFGFHSGRRSYDGSVKNHSGILRTSSFKQSRIFRQSIVTPPPPFHNPYYWASRDSVLRCFVCWAIIVSFSVPSHPCLCFYQDITDSLAMKPG